MQPPRLKTPQLLDQYGRPQRRGVGGGYRLVSNDGHGKRVYEDYDPVTGIKSQITRNHDGSITHRKFQNLDALGVIGKMIKDEFMPHRKKAGGMQQQCMIGAVAYDGIMRRCGWEPGKNGGEYDRKKFDQIVKDSNEPGVIKTRPGRISSQYKIWY